MTDADRTADRAVNRTADRADPADRARPAGEDETDEAFARTVDRQTSSDVAAKALFEREREGATTDSEAAKSLGRGRERRD